MSLLLIDPVPPHAPGVLPWVGAGIRLLRNPTEFFRRNRRQIGGVARAVRPCPVAYRRGPVS